MSRWVVAVLGLAPHAIFAGCLSFVEPPASSDCTHSQSELIWLNPVRLMERVKLPRLSYDRLLYDPALSQGLAVKGDLQFELRAPGPHLVEVFLTVEPGGASWFALEAGGQTVDSRYPAVSKPAGPRAVCLLGMLSGAFTVRSNPQRYVISAIRWTPQKQFEDRLVPSWLDRARQLAADPFLDDLRAERREDLEQLYDRLALSSRPEVHREAVIGQARAAYWLAAEDQDPRNLDRAYSLLREAFKLAPQDKIVRELISSACCDRNVNSGHMPYGGYCVESAPVPWTAPASPDPPNAPEWAVTQRKVAARLEAITKWWVERRQQTDGEVGGGWRSDADMGRQWALQALGLGSPAAAAGIRTLADGLWGSSLPAGAGRSWEILAGVQPLVAALAPEDESVIARLRETAEHAAGPALWNGYFTRGGAGDSRGPDAAGQGFRFAPDSSPFEAAWSMASLAKEAESLLAHDFEMYTSEVIYTDRVYYPLDPRYTRYLFGGEAPCGDRYPGFAVTWPAAKTDFARAVLGSTPTSLQLRLYSFENRPGSAQVRVWQLAPGRYQ